LLSGEQWLALLTFFLPLRPLFQSLALFLLLFQLFLAPLQSCNRHLLPAGLGLLRQIDLPLLFVRHLRQRPRRLRHKSMDRDRGVHCRVPVASLPTGDPRSCCHFSGRSQRRFLVSNRHSLVLLGHFVEKCQLGVFKRRLALFELLDRPLGRLPDRLHFVDSCRLQRHEDSDAVRDDALCHCGRQGVDGVDSHLLHVPV